MPLPKSIEIGAFSVAGVEANPLHLNSEREFAVTGFSYPSYCEIVSRPRRIPGMIQALVLDNLHHLVLSPQVFPMDENESYWAIYIPRCTLKVGGYTLLVRQFPTGAAASKTFRIVR
jgi:hypothetical protein